MRGFKVVCKSDKGEKALLEDLNTNKYVFSVHHVKQKPFIEIDFLFRRTPSGKFFKSNMSRVPEDDLFKHLSEKLEEHGAMREKDFEIEVIK